MTFILTLTILISIAISIAISTIIFILLYGIAQLFKQKSITEQQKNKNGTYKKDKKYGIKV